MGSSHGMRTALRPEAITGAVTAAAAAALSGAAGAVVTFADGRAMLVSLASAKIAGVSTPGIAGDRAGAVIDAAWATLQARAIDAVVAAAVIGVLAVAARAGGTRLRVALTVALAVAAGVWLLNVRDSGAPEVIRNLDVAALFFSVVAVVMAWLPRMGQLAEAGEVRLGVPDSGARQPHSSQHIDPETADARRFRADTVISTLTVPGPLRQSEDLPGSGGPQQRPGQGNGLVSPGADASAPPVQEADAAQPAGSPE
jgi:hypothetical protein